MLWTANFVAGLLAAATLKPKHGLPHPKVTGSPFDREKAKLENKTMIWQTCERTSLQGSLKVKFHFL